MKKSYVLAGVMILAAALLVMPVGAKAEMYVEAYLGGSFPGSSSIDVTGRPIPGFSYGASFPGSFDPAVMGGLKIGTWFVKEGVLGFNYPDWMKYFGFNLDFSFHRLNLGYQHGNYAFRFGGINIFTGGTTLMSEGTCATLAFMFAARYGFLPDSEVPFGRLQPYVAVGPAILFTSQRPTYNVTSANGFPVFGLGGDADSRSSTNVALAVEGGVRYMALKNVSIDLSFKYRYAEPSYTFDVPPFISPASHSVSVNQTLNLFSFQLGAAYHF